MASLIDSEAENDFLMELKAQEMEDVALTQKCNESVTESVMRAEAAEKELAELKAKSSRSKSKTKSESVMRAEAAEKELAELKAKMKSREICHFFAKGYCKNGKKCPYKHSENTEKIKEEYEKKLKCKEEELKLANQFSEMRISMKKQVNQLKVKFTDMYKKAHELDLVIVMDCTSSMSSWITEAKLRINEIVDSCLEAHEDIKVNVGVVAYRDFCDGSDRLNVFSLSDNINKVKEFIHDQKALGGGDGPEDVVGGLQKAIEMKWQAGAKHIILVCDAPCHGDEFHEYPGEDSPISQEHMVNDPDIKTQMHKLAQSGIFFTILEIQPSYTRKMTNILMNEYNKISNSDSKFRLESLKNEEGVEKFKPIVVAAASESITSSLSRSTSDMTKVLCRDKLSSMHHYGPSGLPSVAEEAASIDSLENDIDCIEAPLDWDNVKKCKSEKAIRNTYLMRPGNVDWNNPDLKLVSQNTIVQISNTYFSKGAMRTAHGMIDQNIGKKMVAKSYYKGKQATKQMVSNDVETQAIAKALSHEYSSNGNIPAAVDFLHTSFYELVDRDDNDKMKWIGVEPYISGEYIKYNNNSGFVNPKFKETTQAFSHFTWQFSYGNIMVVDLQGVNYILTDPQIHSKNNEKTKYGEGNLGSDGMALFFHSHKCNDTCRQLKLAPLSSKSMTRKTFDGVHIDLLNDCAEDKEEEEEEEETILLAGGNMELSCVLCGDIFCLKHSDFIARRKKERQSYCPDCDIKVNKHREKIECFSCHNEFDFSRYWYTMVGMEPPKSCKTCKAKAKSKSIIKDTKTSK